MMTRERYDAEQRVLITEAAKNPEGHGVADLVGLLDWRTDALIGPTVVVVRTFRTETVTVHNGPSR
ncbi:hypothetical protein GCM10009066_21330 [Halarchaeum salinum]|uniref:Uncharacterized protein n=1 Tax=Halarchaeum salinum TaxID=489912 RepID=A0AAV3S8H8_9EURY